MLRFRRVLHRVTLGVFGACLGATVSVAATVGAVSVSSPQGDNGGAVALQNIIDQSGLTANYVNGVTDFAAFVGSTTHSDSISGIAGFTNTESNGPQQITFDLGGLFSVSGIGIWNSGSVGSVTRFELFADDDSDFSNGTTGSLIGPSALATATPLVGQGFAFATTDTQFIHFNGLATLAPPDFVGLGEVVFDATLAAVIPVPASLPLLAAGLGWLVLLRRRKPS